MKTITLTAAALMSAVLAVHAGSTGFQPRHLAVLRAGDGELDLKLKQSPVFIDEFIPGNFNSAPLSTIAIPTNGTGLFFNGHAATEGILTRSADHRLLAFAGYGGGLLQTKGTPSLLDIERGFCTVDSAGKIQTLIYKKNGGEAKMNPRGVATDGADNFWGCGNSSGTVYYNPAKGEVEFTSILATRAVKIIGNVLYASVNAAEGNSSDLPAGIYSYVDAGDDATPLPQSAGSKLKPVLEAHAPYTKITGFDINPGETIAYTADNDAGIQKYVKSNGAWKFAYNFSIPQNIPAAENHGTGCFALAVDFSAPAPIIYATTAEGYGGCANSNRVVQIVDTNATATVTVLAQAPGAKIVYRGIDFTPEQP
jgi:hypothetical protein